MPNETALKDARSGLLRLLSYRQRSRQEAEEYLRRKGFDDKLITAVLAEMEQWNYLNDRRFAVEYIENCLRRGLGPLRAQHTLLSRGVDRKTVEEELARYYSPEIESSLARNLLMKRASSGGDLTEKRWIRRQVAYLQRRGFHEGVIVKTIQEHCSLFDE